MAATYLGPTFNLPIGRTKELTIDCYEADTTTALVVGATDVFRFKVWLTDGAAPQIDADSIALLTDTFTTGFAVNNELTSTSPHGLVVGDAIHVSTTTTLPAPLAAETAYWVLTTPTTSTLTIGASKGGAEITLTSDGVGTHTWTQRKSSVTVVTVGSVGVPAQVTVTLDQVDTAQLTADTDYNYELALVDDDDGNRIKSITRGLFRTDGSDTGDIGAT